VGDISFSGPLKYYVEHKYHTYNDSFNEVAPYIRQADISVGNLESPFVSQDVYRHMYKGKKSVILDASPQAAPALRYNNRIKMVYKFIFKLKKTGKYKFTKIEKYQGKNNKP